MRRRVQTHSTREFAVGEVYHVYNRGVEKRDIIEDASDGDRFLESLTVFNNINPVGSIYQHSFTEQRDNDTAPLVLILAYCANPNHYHLLVQPLVEGGLSLFMQKFGAGYTLYFNDKHKRTGALFQGRFKARRVTSDGDLLRMSAYVNVNNKVHQLSPSRAKLVRSSMEEYVEGKKGICDTALVLEHFRSRSAYDKFAKATIKDISRERSDANSTAYKKEFYARYFD